MAATPAKEPSSAHRPQLGGTGEPDRQGAGGVVRRRRRHPHRRDSIRPVSGHGQPGPPRPQRDRREPPPSDLGDRITEENHPQRSGETTSPTRNTQRLQSTPELSRAAHVPSPASPDRDFTTTQPRDRNPDRACPPNGPRSAVSRPGPPGLRHFGSPERAWSRWRGRSRPDYARSAHPAKSVQEADLTVGGCHVWSRIGCLAQYLRVNSEKGPSGAGSQFASRSVPGDPAPAYNVSEPRSPR